MTSPLARIYAIALASLVFFVSWALIAAKPWAPTTNPQLLALAQQVQQQSVALQQQQLGKQSQAGGTTQLASGRARVVTLPPLTITKTS
ncbi:MAG: hypothetical protein ACXVZP_05245 [Gaiellaceae bacterium]